MNRETTRINAPRILVVDDTTANLQLLTNLLTAQGYGCHPASDGELALEFVRATPPDLILLDIKMPGMDGLEVCRRLKAHEATASIPIIFISILEDEGDKVKGFRAGAVDYITKPFQPEEVLARVETHLRLSELTVRLEQEVRDRTGELTTTNQRLQQELSERRKAQADLQRLNRQLRAISDCNQTLLRAQDEQALLNDICRIICEAAGYRMAWVGHAESDPAKRVRPVAWAGVEDGYLAMAKFTWAHTEHGRGPTGTAIRTGASAWIQDLATDPQAAPWRAAALQRGYRSSIALPLKDENAHTFGALNIYSTAPNAFTPEEIQLLEELAGDLAFGITTLRTRAARDQAERELRASEAALRDSEQRYRLVFENSPVSIWEEDFSAVKSFLVDLKMRGITEIETYFAQHPEAVQHCAKLTRIVDVNQAALQLHAATNKAELMANLAHTFTPESFDTFRQELVCLWHGGTEMRADAVVKTLAGEPRHVSVYFSVCSGYEDTLAKVLVSLIDITERSLAEEELSIYRSHLEELVRERTVELETANKELDAFAYSVSHDLRAPLRHIDGFMELLQKKTGTALDEQSRHYMDTISAAAKNMGLLIDDLLSFSRMGRHAISFQHVDLAALVREVIGELEPDAAGREIEWRIGELPAVGGDAAMLRIVLVNLIANALKFTRPRRPARIEIGSQPGQASEAVIFVRDNGVGFDISYVDKLFGVFQRLHRADEFEGTGIGLANVRRIITRHRGRTWAEGQLEQGATFYFALPRTAQGGGDGDL